MSPDPRLFKNPDLREQFAPEIRAAEEQERQEDAASRVLARQQKELQDQQEKAEKEAAELARRTENNTLEREYRGEGRPHYVDAFGKIQPTQDDSTWQASQQKAREQAALEVEWKKQGRKYTRNDFDGSLIPLESDEALAARRHQEGEAIRRETLTKQMDSVRAEAAVGGQPLRDRERREVEKNLKKARQDAALALTPILSERAKQVSGGDDWVPFNESPTDTATKAQERLQRLSDPDVDLDDNDLAILEEGEATRPMAVNLRNLRKQLADDESAIENSRRTKQTLAELNLRRADPAKWEALQREKVSKLEGPALQEHVAATDELLRGRLTDFETKKAELEQPFLRFDQRQNDVTARNQAVLAKGIPAGEMVTLTDGSTWHAPLAKELMAVQAERQALEAENGPKQKALEIEAAEIQREVALHNEASQRAQELQQAQKKTARDTLRFTPGFEGSASALDALDNAAYVRGEQLRQMYPGGVSAEAQQALQQDIEAKSQAAIAAGEQRRQAALAAYSGIRQRLAEDPALNSTAGDLYTQAATNLAQALQVDPKEAMRLIDDAESLDWTTTQGKHGEQSEGTDNFRRDNRTHRILSNGGLVINPKLLSQPEKYIAAVNAAPASPEAKAAAIAALPDQRRMFGQQALEAFRAYSASGFEEWRAKKAKADPAFAQIDEVDQATAYADHLRADSGPVGRLLDQILRRSATGVMSLGSQLLGLAAGVTGSQTMAEGAAAIEGYAGASRAMQTYTGANDALGNRIVGQLAEIIPSTAASMGGGFAARGGLMVLARVPMGERLLMAMSASLRSAKTAADGAKAMQGLMQTAGLAGAAAAGGAQTYGGQIAEIYGALRDQGLDHSEALSGAQVPALLSGAVTTLLTIAGGSTGVEKLLANPAAARELAGKRFQNIVGSFFKEGLKELPEEILDEVFSTVTAELAKNPKASIPDILAHFSESLPELAASVFALGGAGGALQSFRDGRGDEQSAPSPANLPETVAAAESAIDAYTKDGLDETALARTQATARTLLYIAQGDIDSLPDSDLALVGLGRGKDGQLENIKTDDGQPPRVKVENGQPLITEATLQKLAQEMPAVRAAIPLDEVSRRQQIQTSNAQSNDPKNNTTSPDVQAQTAQPGSQPPGTRIPGTGVTNSPGSETPTREGQGGTASPGDVAERTKHIATHLSDRGLTESQAAAAAQQIVAQQGVIGDQYTEQVTAPEFDDAMGKIGWVRGTGKKYQWIPPTDNALPPEVDISADNATDNFPNKAAPAAATLAPSSSDADSSASREGPGQGTAPAAKGAGGSTQGAAEAPPAEAAPASFDVDSYQVARQATIKAIPVAQRKDAVKLLTELDKALTKYAPAFTGVRFKNGTSQGLNRSGGGLEVSRDGKGGVFLNVDLNRWVKQHSRLVDKAGVVAKTEVEEEFIHRAAVNVFTDADMQGFFRSLPANIQTLVYRGYHAVDIAKDKASGGKSFPVDLPDVTDLLATQLGHEFLRMLVQDSAFKGRVSEAVATDPALGERIIGFLQRLVDSLRRLIDAAPVDTRVTIKEYESRVTKEVNRLRRALPNPLVAKQQPQNLAQTGDTRASVLTGENSTVAQSGNFAPTLGATGIAHTDSNDPIEYQWAVVDVNSLNVSNQDDGRINPGYPQELQPRDRTTAGSENQVADIAKNMLLERLSVASGVGDGAPIVGPDGVVESGNGRIMGIRRAYAQGNKPSQVYASRLAGTSGTYGLTPEQVQGIQNPVLVRVRTTDVNRIAFVLAANVSTIAPKREIEQAKIDAKQIVPDLFASFVPSADGDIFTPSNADFIRGFISEIVPPAERPALIDARGNLTQTGLRRIRNALFVHAYGDSPEALNALARLTESIESNGVSIASALVAAAPRFAEQNSRISAGGLYPLSITSDLAQSVQLLQDIRNRGEKVADFLAQDRIPGIGDDPTPVQKAILQFLDENAGRPRAVFAALSRYASAVDGAGDPKQANLFGDEARPTIEELWSLATGRVASAPPPSPVTPPKPEPAPVVTPAATAVTPPAPATQQSTMDAARKIQQEGNITSEDDLAKAIEEKLSVRPLAAFRMAKAILSDAASGMTEEQRKAKIQEMKRAAALRAEFPTAPPPSKRYTWGEGQDPAEYGRYQKSTVALPTTPDIPPPTALKLYRKLKKLEKKKLEENQGGLTPEQSRALEMAERALGQLFMFEDALAAPPAPPEQLALFSSSKSIAPAWIKPVDALEIHDTLGRYGISASDSFRNPGNALARVTEQTDAGTGRSQPGNLPATGGQDRGASQGTTVHRGLQALPRLNTRSFVEGLVSIPVEDRHQGQEHTVYRDRVSGRAIKMTNPGEFGARGSLESYLRQMEEQNTRFDDDITIEGWVQIPGEAAPRLVTSQAWIDGHASSLPEIEAYMRRKGFQRAYDGAWWNGTDLVTDALPKNFVTDDTGHVHPIDVVIAQPTTASHIERLDNLVGSQPQPEPTPEPVRLSAGRRMADTGTMDLFGFNNGMGLESLLTPAQQEVKLKQAQQLDLFGDPSNAQSQPASQRPSRLRTPAQRPAPARQSDGLGDLFAAPGVAGRPRPTGDGTARLPGIGGTGRTDAGSRAVAGKPDAAPDSEPVDSPGKPVQGQRRAASDDAADDDSLAWTRPAPGSPDRNFEPPADLSSLAPAGNKAKVDANLAAITLLKQLEGERRNPTAEEKRVLAAYTGWGAFKEAFNDANEKGMKHWDGVPAYNRIHMPDWLRSWSANWRPLHKQLKEALTEDEYRAASRSTLNAHYTAAPVIRSMWKMVERLGFTGGRALESSAGAGHYLGLQPQGKAADSTQWQAVELDEISARLLSKLYPEATVNEKVPSQMRGVDGLGFERARIPNGSLDLVISNVPFHESGPRKKGFPTLNLHNFFFAHALDKVKPGGLVAFITSASTMQNNQRQREFIASKGDLVAAFRLPNNAFKGNAGTDVVTDIILLRKPDGTAFKGQPWRSLVEVGRQTITLTQGKDQKADELRAEAKTNGTVLKEYSKNGVKAIDVEAPIMVNEYFAAHPDHVLGSHSLQGSMYRGNEYTVTAEDGFDTVAALDRLAAALPANVMGRQEAASASSVLADRSDRPFSFVDRDGSIYEVQDDGTMLEPEWASNPAMVKTFRSWERVKTAIRDLIRAENDTSASDDSLTPLRNALNVAYDTHVAAHGAISRRFGNKHTHLYSDPEYPLTAALENEKVTLEKSGKRTYRYEKAAIMKQRVVRPITPPTKAANFDEALLISMAWRGGIVPVYMAELLGVPVADVIRQADANPGIYTDPSSFNLQTAEAYLSGNIRQKLAEAEEAEENDPQFRKNVEALRNALPERRSIAAVSPTLGARWIPSGIYNAFVRDVLQGTDTVEYVPAGNMFRISGTHLFKNPEYSTRDMSAQEIFESILSLQEPMVYQTIDKQRVFDPTGTAAAKAAAEKMKRAFVEFVKTSTTEIDGETPVWLAAENAYNETQNSYVTPRMKGDYLQFPGLSEDVWRTPHRRAVIARFLEEQFGMMAHGVGSGKTFNQIILSYELRRLGLAKKPMIVVQNSTLGQFAASYLQAYPNAKILVPTERDLQTQNRRKLVSRIATGDYDAVILSHSQYDLIGNKPAAIQGWLGAMVDELKSLILAEKGGDRSRVRDLEGMLKRLEDRLAGMLDALKTRQDSTIYFEDLGVDALIVDEAHNYKSVPIVTRMGRVKGVPSGADSQRAIGMLLKARHVQEKMHGKNVFLATGTPVKNSMAEAYIMMELVAPNVLRDFHIHNFDDFATAFGQVVSSTEISWSGAPKVESRFAKFQNGRELITMIRSAFDVAMGSSLGLKVPKVKGGAPSLDIIPATQTVEDFNAWVRRVSDRWKTATSKEKEEFTAVPIMTLQAGIVAALDPRLIAPKAPDEHGSKVNTAVREMLRIYKEGTGKRTTQLVFADLRRPFDMTYLEGFAGHPFPEYAGAKGDFDLYEDIKRKLIAGGVPEHEILLMDPSMSKTKRTAMFEKVSSGEVRIAVGSTETLGVGVNVQERLKALHHLMPPRDFTPAMHEQRNGRAIRQGNLHYEWDEEIEIHQWGTEGSMDSAVYGTLGRKQRFITQLLMGEAGGDTFDDPTDPIAVNLAEMAARTMGDKDFIRRIEVEKELRDLRLESDAFTSELAGRRSRLVSAQNDIRRLPGEIERGRKTLDKLRNLWIRTAPKPEGVREDTDISDKPVYQFGKLTVDTAAKEGGILNPLDLWLLDESTWVERKQMRQSIGLPLKVNDTEFSVVVELTIPGSKTAGTLHFEGNRVDRFTGADGLIRALRDALPAIERRVNTDESYLSSIQANATKLQALLERDSKFSKSAELAALEEELQAVDARLAAKAAPPPKPAETASAAPLATSSKSVDSKGDEDSPSLDRWTSSPTRIEGRRVTREQGQALGASWRARLREGLREPETFDWSTGPALAQRLSQVYPGIPVLTDRQFNELSNLPIIGGGIEGTVYEDKAGGVVYKVLENTGKTGAGIWNELRWTSRGRIDWAYQPAARPRHLGLRLALLNLMGGTPTELAGISPGGLLILKQPLSPDPELGHTGNLYAARRESGIVDVPAGMLMEDGYKAHVVVVEGRPWLVTDLLPDNYVGDNQGNVRINDPIFGQITTEIIQKVPGLGNVVKQAADEAQRLGDRARLFKGSVSLSEPTGSNSQPASPLARMGYNHLDRHLSAKLAAFSRWMNEKTGAGETVARWKGQENARPFVSLARVFQRELFPDSVLPREVAAKKREMEIKTSLGAQRGMDLVRALTGTPKFSDLVYPSEFASNPVHRRNLYLAMTGERPMTSLPPEMQRLAKRLRDTLLEMGREAVKQGRMSLETFEGLQAVYMPHYYKEDVQREKSLFHRFRLGLRDILAQRTTAWHIVDMESKGTDGQPRLVSWQGNQWRFRNEEHRNAFFEDFILQEALQQITSRSKATRNLTLADLRAPATLTPETQGRLKEILGNLRTRYRKERPLSVDEQEKAGLIMDPVYSIARYVAQMSHDNSTAEFFNYVAGNPLWTSDTASPGYMEIPDNPRFGRLAGKHVTDDIARQLLEMVEAPNQALQIYDTLMGWWKTGKTVLNPGTHVRNILGNLFFSQLAGTSLWNPGNVRFYKQSISALRNGGRDLMEAYEMGVLGADFVSAELRQTLRQLLPDPATINEDKPDVLMGIGKAIGRFIPQLLANPAHRAYNQIAALYQAEDEVFKMATFLKAKAMGMTAEQARDHVRQWYPYFDRGTSGTLKTIGRTAMPFLGFYRESIRIFGEALKNRPIALAAGLAVPSLLTFLSAMILGLDDDELEQVKKDMRGRAGKLLGPTPLEGMPLFSMLLPVKSDTGALQQWDISAVHPFVDFLGNRVEASHEDWWQQTLRSIVAAGPIGSLLYSQMTGRDSFGDRTFVEDNMTGTEKLAARADNVVKTLAPPLFPGGTGFTTLANAGERTTNKTLETRNPVQAVARAVVGVDVRNATPDLYRMAEDFRKANKLPTTEGMDFGSTTPTSRARKALFAALAQDEPNLTAVKNITRRLQEMGAPVRDAQDLQKLLWYKNPLMIIKGQENQQRFRASLSGLERQALESAIQEYEKIKARAPGIIRQAQVQ